MNPVATSTVSTGPNRTLNDPDTCTKSEIPNKNRSAENPTNRAPARSNTTGVVVVPVRTKNPSRSLFAFTSAGSPPGKLRCQSITACGCVNAAPTHGVPWFTSTWIPRASNVNSGMCTNPTDTAVELIAKNRGNNTFNGVNEPDNNTGVANTIPKFTFSTKNPTASASSSDFDKIPSTSVARRSEERRVGKECR